MEEWLHRELHEAVEPIVSGMGFSLVELRPGRSKNQNHLAVIIYRREGVSIDDCTAISKNLLPRLELIEGLENLRLEVSSPGLDRVLKSEREYELFAGRRVRLWLRGQTEPIGGIIEEAAEGELRLAVAGKARMIPLSDIRKAKLDDS